MPAVLMTAKSVGTGGGCHHQFVETGIRVFTDETSAFCRYCLKPKPKDIVLKKHEENPS
jgi:hypothetical protein